MKTEIEDLLTNTILYSREEAIANPCPIPNQKGIYAWFFRDIPKLVPLDNCYTRDGFTLLYIGIAPSSSTSKSNLRKRIKTQHLKGNAYGSTLRLTLGCILEEHLNITLKQYGTRVFFGDDEEVLNDWLNKNARVAYLIDDEPWEIEESMINQLDLPLNLEHNKQHPFYAILKKIRSEARKKARDK